MAFSQPVPGGLDDLAVLQDDERKTGDALPLHLALDELVRAIGLCDRSRSQRAQQDDSCDPSAFDGEARQPPRAIDAYVHDSSPCIPQHGAVPEVRTGEVNYSTFILQAPRAEATPV